MSAPRWLVFLLGLFGVTLLVKNAMAGQGEVVPGPSEPVPGAVSPAKYPYEAELRAAAVRSKVDPDLVAAIVSWEQRSGTRWDPLATNPADPSYGLGQVTPYIGARFGAIASEADWRGLYVPEKNLRAVAAFLAYLLNEMRYPLEDAIQMYNLGEPKFWAGLREPGYLAGVQGYYKIFRGGAR